MLTFIPTDDAVTRRPKLLRAKGAAMAMQASFTTPHGIRSFP